MTFVLENKIKICLVEQPKRRRMGCSFLRAGESFYYENFVARIINRPPNQLVHNMETLSYSDSGVDAVRQRATSQPKASFGKRISLIKIVQIMFGLQQSLY